MNNSYADIVDTDSFAPNLAQYNLVSVGGNVNQATLTGYFVDIAGVQLTNVQTFTIGAAAQTFNQLANPAIPATAVGFVGTLAGSALWIGLNGATNNPETPKAGYPQMAPSNRVTFGRVYSPGYGF